MKISKRKIASVAIMGLAAAAFALDRWVFVPDSADAAAGADLLVPKTSHSASPGPEGAATPALAGLATRLTDVCATAGINPDAVKNVFHASPSWLASAAPPPPEPKPAPAPVNVAATAAAQFRDAHKLLAVMKSANGGLAIIDGKTIRRGQSIDGFRLIAVRERSAVLRSDVATVELTIVEGE